MKDVARAIGMDERIGAAFLNAGPGYGGSCFPKDTLAFTQIGRQYEAPQSLIERVIEVNNARQEEMAERIISACGGNVEGKKIGILGVSFKPDTDDVRDAPSLVIIPQLQLAGATVAAFDPVAMNEAKKQLENVEWCQDAYQVAKDADALVILTEWKEFRALNISRLEGLLKEKRIIDLRNIYNPETMKERNFHYVPVGKPEIKPQVELKEVGAV